MEKEVHVDMPAVKNRTTATNCGVMVVMVEQ